MAQRISVSVSAQKLLDEAPPDNRMSVAVINAVRNNYSIPAAVISALGGGFDSNVDDYYDAGEAEQTVGVPLAFNFAASPEFVATKSAAVKAAIAADEGISASYIVVTGIEIQYTDPTWVMREFIWDAGTFQWNWGFIEDYGEFSVDRAKFTQSGLIIWNGTNQNNEGDSLDFTSRSMSQGDFTPSTIAYHATYYVKSSAPGTYWQGAARQRIFNYANGTDGIPSLEIDGDLIIGGRYFPMTPIRVNKVWVDSHPYWQGRIPQINEILGHINLEYANLKDAIDPTGKPGSTSELANLDDAIIMFAVDVRGTTDAELNILFEMFKRFHYTADGATQDEWWAWKNETGIWAGQDWEYTNRPRTQIDIRATSIQMTLEYQYSTAQIVTGNINTDAVPSGAKNSKPHGPANIENEVVPTGNVVRKYAYGTAYGAEDQQSGTWRDSRLVLRKPRDGYAGQYIEIVVVGCRMIYEVARPWGDDGLFYRELNSAENTSWNDGGMVIPLSQDIVKLFDTQAESAIYYDSLQLVMYASEIYDISWWQGAFASFLFFVVQVVVTIATLGAGIGLVAAAREGLFALAKAIAIHVIAGIALQYALVQVINILGVDVGIILAAIAAVGAVYAGASSSSIMGVFDAKAFISIADSLLDATQEVIRDDFLKLQKEIELYEDEQRQKEDEVERLIASRETGSVALDLYQITRGPLRQNFTEGPENFYNRTIHQTNPGVLSLTMVQMYVTYALELPDPEYN